MIPSFESEDGKSPVAEVPQRPGPPRWLPRFKDEAIAPAFRERTRRAISS